MSPNWPKKEKLAVSILFAVVVALAGIGFADWPWSVEIALRLLFGVGTLIFLTMVSNLVAGAVIRRLQAEKAGLAGEASASRALLERVATRQTPLFDDRIELTVVVGDDDDADIVDQRIWTNPTPQVAHRVMRPIVPDDGRVHGLGELDLECSVVDGAETTVSAFPLLAELKRLLVLIDFDPIVDEEIEWRVRYRPRGLWRPLRETGRDCLWWDDQKPRNAYGHSPLRDFKIIFVFPGSWTPRVVEPWQYGKTEPRRRRADGRWEIEWHDSSPEGRRYKWDLHRIASSDLGD
jgi:hypothetical protein